ncbi:PadR family transcriptional regulator [Labedaea rhizosphaerae]|uniref:PadR family transcriptional regulator n=1 Tax=Labedaea rhizosphaerae TaxID=598644 RepID=A0A4R6S265_LABRH|nr:PadR family transcriptional regulator [Labedaea rhizosphaerae]TDP93652.1 PadR family transcriptional regulator [Labedaea rhizosphaerae]
MRDQKLTPLALAVLDLLHERDMHPYEMHQTMLTRQTDQRMKIKAGSLYHTVDRLLEHGLIDARETTREGRRPERTVYGLTESGAAAFTARLKELVTRVPTEYPEFPIALSMVHNLTRGDAIELLGRRIIQQQAKVASLRAIADGLAARELPPMYWIDVRYTQAVAEAELTWTEGFLEQLKAGHVPWPDNDKENS